MKVWTAITTTGSGFGVIAQGGDSLRELHEFCKADDPCWSRRVRFAMRDPIPNKDKMRFMIALDVETNDPR